MKTLEAQPSPLPRGHSTMFRSGSHGAEQSTFRYCQHIVVTYHGSIERPCLSQESIAILCATNYAGNRLYYITDRQTDKILWWP